MASSFASSFRGDARGDGGGGHGVRLEDGGLVEPPRPLLPLLSAQFGQLAAHAHGRSGLRRADL